MGFTFSPTFLVTCQYYPTDSSPWRFGPQKWRQDVSPNCWCLPTKLCCVTTWKTTQCELISCESLTYTSFKLDSRFINISYNYNGIDKQGSNGSYPFVNSGQVSLVPRLRRRLHELRTSPILYFWVLGCDISWVAIYFDVISLCFPSIFSSWVSE
jgi:hypothetical protein